MFAPDVVEGVRAAVPSVGFANLVIVPVTFLLTWATTRLAAWLGTPALRPELSWWERARLTLGARTGALGMGVLAATVMPLVAWGSFAGPFSRVPPRVLVIATAAVALLGMIPAMIRADRLATRRRIPTREWLATWVLNAFLFLPSLGVALVSALGVALGLPSPLAVLSTTVLVTWGGFPFLRLVGLVRPSPRVLDVMQRLAGSMNLPGRLRGYEVTCWPANAFAIPGANVIAFTRPTLAAFPDDEIEAICRHEIGHLLEGRRVRVLRVVTGFGGPCMVLGILQVFAPWGRAAPILGLVAIATGFALRMGAVRISRKHERLADLHGAGHDERAYGRALLRLTEMNGAPLVGAAPGVHGHPYDRAARTGIPLPPRPESPPRLRPLFASMVSIFVFVLALGIMVSSTQPRSHGSLMDAERRAVLSGGKPDQLEQLALARAWQRDPSALPLLAGAARFDERTAEHHGLDSAMVLARLGECGVARRLLDRAESSMNSHPEERAHFDEATEDVERCESER